MGHDTVTLLPQPEPLRFPNSLFIYPVIFPSSLPVLSLGPGEGTLTTTRHLEAVKQATDPSDNPMVGGDTAVLVVVTAITRLMEPGTLMTSRHQSHHPVDIV